MELEKVTNKFEKKTQGNLTNYFLQFQYRQFAHELDAGRFPEGMQQILDEVGAMKQE